MGLTNSKIPPEERLKQFKVELRKSVRAIERERLRIQRSETKIKADMKRLAAKGENESVMILAKDLVRQRVAMNKMLKMGSQIEALGLRIETIKAQNGAMQALKGATGAMVALNKMVNVPQMQAIMQQFIQENEIMEMKNEMVDEAMDEVWDVADEDIEAENAAAYVRIFQELGIPAPPGVAQYAAA